MAKTALLSFFLGLAFLVAACSGPKPLPKGPPPEYEDEPVVSAGVGADAGGLDVGLKAD